MRKGTFKVDKNKTSKILDTVSGDSGEVYKNHDKKIRTLEMNIR